MFADVNIPAVDDELSYKLGPRFTEPTITFPIVHVGGKLLLTPTPEQIEEELNKFAAANSNGEVARDYTMFLNGADPAPHY